MSTPLSPRRLFPDRVPFLTPKHRCHDAARRRQARRVLVVWSERGREARLPVSAGRIHDAARERRTPWSVTPDCGRPAALTRGAAKGTTCSCILSALYLLDGPNLGSRAKALQPAPTTCRLQVRCSRAGGKLQAKLVHCFAPHGRPCRWASGWFASPRPGSPGWKLCRARLRPRPAPTTRNAEPLPCLPPLPPGPGGGGPLARPASPRGVFSPPAPLRCRPSGVPGRVCSCGVYA